MMNSRKWSLLFLASACAVMSLSAALQAQSTCVGCWHGYRAPPGMHGVANGRTKVTVGPYSRFNQQKLAEGAHNPTVGFSGHRRESRI